MANLVANSAFDYRVIKAGKNPTIPTIQEGYSMAFEFSNKVAHQLRFKPLFSTEVNPAEDNGENSPDSWVIDWSANIKGKPYFSLSNIDLDSLVSRLIETNTELTLASTPGQPVNSRATQLMKFALQTNDQIVGSRAKDWLAGFEDNDTLNGGKGNDVLVGGTGADVFQFSHYGSRDAGTLEDFTAGIDKIALDRSIFTKLPEVLTDDMLVIKAKSKALDANDWLLLDSAKGKLYYDADGNGKGKPQLIAKLTGIHDLDASDFVVLDQVA